MTTYNSVIYPPGPTPVPNIAISNGGTGGAIPGASSQWINTTNLGIGQVTQSAFQIRGDPQPVLTIGYDGVITTQAGTISVEDWIQVIKLMKRFITDVANDEETAKKYPYLKDAAHQWVMDELRK